MSRCIHVYPFVARNHGGIPFSGVCPFYLDNGLELTAVSIFYSIQQALLTIVRHVNGRPRINLLELMSST